MNTPPMGTIVRDGLWRNNPASIQLLGLCPLLAVSGSVVNGLGLGLASLAVLLASGLVVSLVREWLRPEIRIVVFVLVIACFVTTVDLLMQAYRHELHRVLGIFVPLIVTNCAILGRAEAFASRQPVLPALADALFMGLGFTAVLVILGGIREALGQGTLLAGAETLFGPAAADWRLDLAPGYRGFILALLPPGAFITLGLMIAVANHLFRSRSRAPAHDVAP